MTGWLMLGDLRVLVSRIEAYAIAQDPVGKNVVTTVWVRGRAEPFEVPGDYAELVQSAVARVRRG